MSNLNHVAITSPQTGNAPDLTPRREQEGQDFASLLDLVAVGSVDIDTGNGLAPQPIVAPISRSAEISTPDLPLARREIPEQSPVGEKLAERPVAKELIPLERRANPEKLEVRPTPAATTQKSDDSSTELLARQKRLRAALANQLEDINVVLSAIVQALSIKSFVAEGSVDASATIDSSVVATSLTTTSAEFSATSVSVDWLTFFTQQSSSASVQSPLAQSASFTTAFSSVNTTSPEAIQTIADDAALLKDIQQLLQNLRSALQEASAAAGDTLISQVSAYRITSSETLSVNVQYTATQQEAIPDLQLTLQDAIKSIKALVQRLAPESQDTISVQITSGATDTTLPAESAAQGGLGKLLSSLKDGIAVIRNQLTALRDENEQIFSGIRQATSASLPAPDLLSPPQEAPSIEPSSLLPTDALSIIAESAAAGIAADAEAPLTGSTPAPVTPSGSNATLTAQAVAAVAGNLQSGTDNLGGQSQQGSPQNPNASSQPAAATSSQGAIASTTPKVTPFEKALDRSTPLLVKDQIGFQVKQAVKQGTSQIHIQLDPEELGKLDIKLTVEASGKTGVHIVVETRQTLELLQRDSASLARTLADAGLNADSSSLSFNLRSGDQQQPQGQQGQAAMTYKKSQPEELALDSAPVVQALHQPISTSEGLDITI